MLIILTLTIVENMIPTSDKSQVDYSSDQIDIYET